MVGWVLPDLIVGPRAAGRLGFGLLPVAVGIGGFWLGAMAWGPPGRRCGWVA